MSNVTCGPTWRVLQRRGYQRGKTPGKMLCGLMLLVPFFAAAQVQRSFINLGFEDPDLGGSACSLQLPASMVPGWQTTHGLASTGGSCPPPSGMPASGQLIELWANGGPLNFGVTGMEGTQYAELNAAQSSRIYQTVCLLLGDRVSWSFQHRGRYVGQDVAEFNVNSNVNTVVTARTNNAGATTYNGATDCLAADGAVTASTCTAPALVNTWRHYSGSFTWNGGAGTQNVGFEAVSTAASISEGNLIDNINFEVRPLVEFTSATYTVPEQGGGSISPKIKVVGVVRANMTVGFTITGSAASGTDFNVATLAVPAGDYGEGQEFDVPITLIDDSIIENNETIALTLVPDPASYTISSTNTCGAMGVAASIVTIVDNDVDLRSTKSVSNAAPAVGESFTYTVKFENNTAAPSVAPLNAHDVTAAVADALPAGLTFDSWTCVASAGAICTIANGSGAIAGNVTLPARGDVTYTITARATGTPHCAAITNSASITLPVNFQEGGSVQAGFASPTPGGVANNSASAEIDPVCPTTVTLQKVSNGVGAGPFTFALTNTTQATGSAITAAGGTPVSVDGGAVAGIQPFTVTALGAAVTIEETSLPAGWLLRNATCSAGAGIVGSLSGTTYTIPAAAVTEAAALMCTFTNGRQTAELTITKSNGGTTVVAGAPTTYTIVVTNQGPDTADGAIVTDALGAGLSGCSAICPAALLTGGAACPASAQNILAAGGAALPQLPALASVTFQVTCNVQ
jgi:uncharacterized repeat protein (TIGR01451 family)